MADAAEAGIEPQIDTLNRHLARLCVQISDRSVGSEGNRAATTYFEGELGARGWATETPEFDVMDWRDGGAALTANGVTFEVFVSPYSIGTRQQATLVAAATAEDLEDLDATGKVILLHSDIAKEQLMPKNFPFYSVEEQQRIVALLEASGAVALICATGRNTYLAGGAYPSPMIEDGDFDIPSVYLTEEEGQRLLPFVGQEVSLSSQSKRLPAKACNVIGKINPAASERIVITAHIDAKKGSPGALDNATGVATLLLLADLLADYDGDKAIELIAFNGEDYYSVPGQVNYMSANQNTFDGITLNINIDGVGYQEGSTAYSFFGLPDDMQAKARARLLASDGTVEGIQWPQGDHTMFVQFGRPAVAVTSNWLLDNMATQTITHTTSDTISAVDVKKIAACATAIASFVQQL